MANNQVLPFILRRTKSEVLPELPTKTIIDVCCPLSEEQKNLYATFQRGLKISDAELEKILIQENSALPTVSNGLRPFEALRYLSLLSVHPAIVVKGSHPAYRNRLISNRKSSGKVLALLRVMLERGVVRWEECAEDVFDDLYGEEEGPVVGSDEDAVPLLMQQEDDEWEEEEDVVDDPGGSKKRNSGKKRNKSSKSNKKRKRMESVTATVDSAAKETVSSETDKGGHDTHKCLIFARHRASLDIIETCVMQRLFPTVSYSRLDGSVSPSERAATAAAFNSSAGTHLRILLLTVSSCGLGLGLTAADTVVFLEHSWNPFEDVQAADRAHRIGQKRPVVVYRLLGTFCSKILMTLSHNYVDTV